MITAVNKDFFLWPLRAAMLALALHAAPSFAQTYPAKALRIVVAYAPGGTNDISARAIGQKLTELWGVPVIGTELVAKSPPDGYTLLLTPPSFTTNPTYLPKLPYDTLRDFAPITLLNINPQVLVVNPSVPARTAKELAALARAARRHELQFVRQRRGQPSGVRIVQRHGGREDCACAVQRQCAVAAGGGERRDRSVGERRAGGDGHDQGRACAAGGDDESEAFPCAAGAAHAR
jgi:hypothetical protein